MRRRLPRPRGCRPRPRPAAGRPWRRAGSRGDPPATCTASLFLRLAVRGRSAVPATASPASRRGSRVPRQPVRFGPAPPPRTGPDLGDEGVEERLLRGVVAGGGLRVPLHGHEPRAVLGLDRLDQPVGGSSRRARGPRRPRPRPGGGGTCTRSRRLAPTAARQPAARRDLDVVGGREAAHRVAVGGAGRSGRCCSSVPPKATLTTCMPRQMARMGSPRAGPRRAARPRCRPARGRRPYWPGGLGRRSGPGRGRRRRPAGGRRSRRASPRAAPGSPPGTSTGRTPARRIAAT